MKSQESSFVDKADSGEYSKHKFMRYVGIIFACVLFLCITPPLFAQTATPSSSMVHPQPTYDFPYPGMLPDNPLYFLKAFRDRMVSILISDPLKKAQFDLLNSDKRVVAGLDMFNRGKAALGVTTISKSNNYFDEALGQLTQAKNMKEDTVNLTQTMKSALLKRQELFTNQLQHTHGSAQTGLQQEENRVVSFEKKLGMPVSSSSKKSS